MKGQVGSDTSLYRLQSKLRDILVQVPNSFMMKPGSILLGFNPGVTVCHCKNPCDLMLAAWKVKPHSDSLHSLAMIELSKY